MSRKSRSARPAVDARGSISYLLQRLVPFRLPVAHHRASGLRLRFLPRDVVGRTILRYQSYEAIVSDYLFGRLRLAATQGLFVDVGANIGWFSLNAARIPAVEAVLAFEPDPGNHALLSDNVELNQAGERVLAISCALGSGPGFATLHRYKDRNPGRHSLLEAHGYGRSVVTVNSLDSVLDHLGHRDTPIHALKLDVEGYEPAVIAGAAQALARTSIVVIELSRELSERGGLDFRTMLQTFAEHSFMPVAWDQPDRVPDWQALRTRQDQCTVVLERSAESTSGG
jgi:FkbM family methyltransferase